MCVCVCMMYACVYSQKEADKRTDRANKILLKRMEDEAEDYEKTIRCRV